MLKRKIDHILDTEIARYKDQAILIVGARQVGKTYSIISALKRNDVKYHYLNFGTDLAAKRLFNNVLSKDDFYRSIYLYFIDKIEVGSFIFLDEIQEVIELISILKELVIDNRFKFIISGSLLGVFLKSSSFIPIGYLKKFEMFPLDLEEFIMNYHNEFLIHLIKESFNHRLPLDQETDMICKKITKEYILIGGLPQVVDTYITNKDYQESLKLLNVIEELYYLDFSKYNINKRPTLKRIYDVVPTLLLKSNRQFVLDNLEKNTRYSQIVSNLDWLKESGYIYFSHMIKNPKLGLSLYQEHDFKIYYFDIGILMKHLGRSFCLSFMSDDKLINTGGVYENFIASELCTANIPLRFYYQKKLGEVDFLIESYPNILPIEIKSSSEYEKHKALDSILQVKEYSIKEAYVLCNTPIIKTEDSITYLPLYYIIALKEKYSNN